MNWIRTIVVTFRPQASEGPTTPHLVCRSALSDRRSRRFERIALMALAPISMPQLSFFLGIATSSYSIEHIHRTNPPAHRSLATEPRFHWRQDGFAHIKGRGAK